MVWRELTPPTAHPRWILGQSLATQCGPSLPGPQWLVHRGTRYFCLTNENLLRCCSDYSREMLQALRWPSLQRTNNPRTSGLPGRENLSENEANVGPGLEAGESEGGETKSWHNRLRPGSSNDSAGFRSYTFQFTESVKPLFSFGGFGVFFFFLVTCHWTYPAWRIVYPTRSCEFSCNVEGTSSGGYLAPVNDLALGTAPRHGPGPPAAVYTPCYTPCYTPWPASPGHNWTSSSPVLAGFSGRCLRVKPHYWEHLREKSHSLH